MKRWMLLATLALPLAGCMLPPAVSVASLAVDVGSFAATGKTATDHAISGLAGQNCRVSGILEGQICEEKQAFEAATASLEPLRPLPEEAPLAGLDYLSAGLPQPDLGTPQMAALRAVPADGHGLETSSLEVRVEPLPSSPGAFRASSE